MENNNELMQALEQVQEATQEKKRAYGQQGTATPEEAAERAAQLKTQGRKGCKAVRINMAFTPDNHQFVKIMARISGQSMTEFTNYVIEQYRKEHPEIFEQAKDIISKL